MSLTLGRPPALRRFLSDRRGTSAIEFAIVSTPFILVLIMTLQMGIYFMAKSSLDAGVVRTADSLVKTFYSGATPTVPTPAQLRTLVVQQSGGLIQNDATLCVELRQFTTMAATPGQCTDPGNSGTVDVSAAGQILELRALASIPWFVPGLGGLAVVRSAAIVRRQAF